MPQSEITPRVSTVHQRQYGIYKALYERTKDLMREVEG